MLYMVIENFKDAPAIYARFRERGRMMPDGLEYVSSWIAQDRRTCWQVMRTDDVSLFDRWMENWQDLMDFKIVPVQTSTEVVESMSVEASPQSAPDTAVTVRKYIVPERGQSYRRGTDNPPAKTS